MYVVDQGNRGRAGVVRRTVHLCVGAAVALAFIILAMGIYAPLQPSAAPARMVLFLPMVLVPMALVGLLPGVRELQVAGAQSLLGTPDVVVPEPMRPAHRWRTALFTFTHQVVGAMAGLAILAGILAAGTVFVLLTGQDALTVPGYTLERPTDTGGWALVLGVVVAVIAGSVALVWAAGVAAVWSAPLLLGPLGQDRLALAEQRLAAEKEYRRLSRDLHDGVGHSLSAISLQATAGRRLLDRAPASTETTRAEESLRVIADLAAQAVTELDHVLGTLRVASAEEGADAVTDRVPVQRATAGDLGRLEALIAEHRDRGMSLAADVRADPAAVAAVLSRAAYRICAEALANAAKHGEDLPVRLSVHDGDASLRIEVTNPLGPAGGVSARPAEPRSAGSSPRYGRGLAGLAESVELLEGTIQAGPEEDRWVLRAELPRGGRGD